LEFFKRSPPRWMCNQITSTHGALYNMAVRDANLADAIARAVESIDPKLILFAPDKGELARAGEAHGLQIAREISPIVIT